MAYHKRIRRQKVPSYRRNDYIGVPLVLLVDETGKNLGEIATDKARKMAEEKELDLVEIAPNAKPPVCKIMSWTKFKYEFAKRKRTSSKGKVKKIKGMWFSPYIDDGDIKRKLELVKGFLDDKHPVKLTIKVKGRVQRNIITSQLNKILKLLEGKYEIEEMRPRNEGKNLSITVFPTKQSK